MYAIHSGRASFAINMDLSEIKDIFCFCTSNCICLVLHFAQCSGYVYLSDKDHFHILYTGGYASQGLRRGSQCGGGRISRSVVVVVDVVVVRSV